MSGDSMLVDIASRLGDLEGQNRLILQEQMRATQSRSETYKLHEENKASLAALRVSLGHVEAALKEITPKIEPVAAVVKDVADMKPDVEEMKAFKAKLALACVMVTAVITGALNLIVYAVSNLGQIKTLLKEFLK